MFSSKPSQHPPISYPLPSPPPSLPMPTIPKHTRGSSLSSTVSSTMRFLTRAPTNATSKERQIRSIEIISPRIGVLGEGAIVIEGTAHDVLQSSYNSFQIPEEPQAKEQRTSSSSWRPDPDFAGLPEEEQDDRPLPRVPLSDSDTDDESESEITQESTSPNQVKETEPVPLQLPATTVSWNDTQPEYMDEVPPTPSTSTDVEPLSALSDFEILLLSEVPPHVQDPSRLIVTLDTCTATYRTMFKTLVSRPSRLASYLISLFPQNRSRRSSVSSSIYSSSSVDGQTSSGTGLSAIHLFLDRPSAPYEHILSYLRSPAQQKPTLPRHLQQSDASRLHELYQLQDEAAFLGLEELEKLCAEKIVSLASRRVFSLSAQPELAQRKAQLLSVHSGTHTKSKSSDFKSAHLSPAPATNRSSHDLPQRVPNGWI